MQAKKISIIAMLLIAAILVGFAAPTVFTRAELLVCRNGAVCDE